MSNSELDVLGIRLSW